MARQENIKVKKYHWDNGIFATTAFKTHCESQQQEFSFGGVGAHHQNGVAKKKYKNCCPVGTCKHASFSS
jgi:hypothetical protein